MQGMSLRSHIYAGNVFKTPVNPRNISKIPYLDGLNLKKKHGYARNVS